jgi:hypothetical protein
MFGSMDGWFDLAFGLVQNRWEIGPSSCVGNGFDDPL